MKKKERFMNLRTLGVIEEGVFVTMTLCFKKVKVFVVKNGEQVCFM